MTPSGVLGTILKETRARLAETPFDQEAYERRAAACDPPPDAMSALGSPGIRIIAEVKRRSPSQGAIRAATTDPAGIALRYEQAGAAAVSVLTEPNHFGGSLEDLEAVTGRCSIPVLRKDFIVSRRQLLEARVSGASLVLLIVAGLSDRELSELHADALALGLTPLVETHTEDEVRRALDIGATIVGINSRDLVSLKIDLSVAESLRQLVPTGVLPVAESGIGGKDDLERLRAGGFDVFLIGSSLMAAPDPGAALAHLLEAA